MANALLFATTPEPVTNQLADRERGPRPDARSDRPAGAPFTVTGVVADPDGDTLTIAWTGTGLVGDQPSFSGTLPPPVGVTAVSYTLTLTVSDGNGGLVSDDVVITVRDTTGPVLANVPASIVTATATSASGRNVAYGPMTAADAGGRELARDLLEVGHVPHRRHASSPAPPRRTRAGTAPSATFTVRVLDVTTPGAMWGDGIIRVGRVRYDIEFGSAS